MYKKIHITGFYIAYISSIGACFHPTPPSKETNHALLAVAVLQQAVINVQESAIEKLCSAVENSCPCNQETSKTHPIQHTRHNRNCQAAIDPIILQKTENVIQKIRNASLDKKIQIIEEILRIMLDIIPIMAENGNTCACIQTILQNCTKIMQESTKLNQLINWFTTCY